jgi:MFS family permease
MVASSSERMLTRFAFEMSQNLYFVGVVLTYVLWGAMMKMQENRTRLIQLVLGLGVFLSAFAGSYALRNMYPDHIIWRYFIAILAIWLPASWTYTFLKVPEEARMSTAQMVSPVSR